MQCLDNYIGIRALTENCGAPSSVSGLYLEDLEGLTLSKLASIETGKQMDARVLFAQLLNRAGRQMLEEMKILLMPYLRMEASIEGGWLGKFGEATCAESKAELKTCHGRLARFVLEKVRVKFNHTGEVVLTLTDGQHTETKTITTEAGVEQELQWFYVAKTENVTITAPVEGYAGTLQGGWKMGERCGDCLYRFVCCNQTTRMACGITVQFTVQCDFEKMLCAALPHLNQPLLLSLGCEVLKEWEASDRLNFLTLHGKEWAAAKHDEWTMKRNEMLNAATQGIARMLQSMDDKCVTCGGYSYGYQHP